MNRYLGLGLLAVGVILAIYGIQASESFSSDFSRFFTGSPTDRSVWLLLGGVACVAVGLAVALRSPAKAAA